MLFLIFSDEFFCHREEMLQKFLSNLFDISKQLKPENQWLIIEKCHMGEGGSEKRQQSVKYFLNDPFGTLIENWTNRANQCHTGERGGGVRKAPTKCHVFFEWPLLKIYWALSQLVLKGNLNASNTCYPTLKVLYSQSKFV